MGYSSAYLVGHPEQPFTTCLWQSATQMTKRSNYTLALNPNQKTCSLASRLSHFGFFITQETQGASRNGASDVRRTGELRDVAGMTLPTAISDTPSRRRLSRVHLAYIHHFYNGKQSPLLCPFTHVRHKGSILLKVYIMIYIFFYFRFSHIGHRQGGAAKWRVTILLWPKSPIEHELCHRKATNCMQLFLTIR